MLSEHETNLLDKKFFNENDPVMSSPTYINSREICGRHKLPPGNYSIVPTTFEPKEEGEFLLRIFTEKPHSFRYWDVLNINANDLPNLKFLN